MRFDDKEYVCVGSTVYWEERRGSATVHQTPREVRELMRSSSEDLLELSHYSDPDIPVYIDRRKIVAVTPYWNKVETG